MASKISLTHTGVTSKLTPVTFTCARPSCVASRYHRETVSSFIDWSKPSTNRIVPPLLLLPSSPNYRRRSFSLLSISFFSPPFFFFLLFAVTVFRYSGNKAVRRRVSTFPGGVFSPPIGLDFYGGNARPPPFPEKIVVSQSIVVWSVSVTGYRILDSRWKNRCVLYRGAIEGDYNKKKKNMDLLDSHSFSEEIFRLSLWWVLSFLPFLSLSPIIESFPWNPVILALIFDSFVLISDRYTGKYKFATNDEPFDRDEEAKEDNKF